MDDVVAYSKDDLCNDALWKCGGNPSTNGIVAISGKDPVHSYNKLEQTGLEHRKQCTFSTVKVKERKG